MSLIRSRLPYPRKVALARTGTPLEPLPRTSAALGVAAPFTATGLVGCAIANTTPASLVLVDIDGGMVAQTDLARFAGPLGVGSAVVAYWPGGSGGSGACGAALGMDQTEGVFMAPRPANQQAGVFAQDVDARVRYLYAYTP